MNEELCEKCKEFDRVMNRGPVSSDFWVICTHKQPERLNETDHESDMRKSEPQE